MKHYIGHLLAERAAQEYRKLVADICQRFDLKDLRKKNRIPHITFRSPFQIEDITQLELLMEIFCRELAGSYLELNGIDHFDSNFVYIRVFPSEEMLLTFKSFERMLTRGYMPPQREYDGENKILHVTVARGEETGGKFEEIFSYLADKQFRLITSFDNITIFRKVVTGTEIEKIYRF